MIKGFLKGMLTKTDVPGEVLFDVPYISVTGDFSVTVENYRGIIAYEETGLKINTKSAILKIEGEALTLLHITDEIICVSGKIKSLEFI